MRGAPDEVDHLWAELLEGRRAALSRAITAVESQDPAQRAVGLELARRARGRPEARAWRVGLTGPPGVGKSTLIALLGARLVQQGARPAVLAVDPSSSVSGGSLLGDQSRMAELTRSDQVFIRPSPARSHLGGVGVATGEALALCAAAGFGPLLLETVGVGQSESEAAELVDYLVVLLQPGAGDDLQGMKRGLLERADRVVVARADGAQRALAEATARAFQAALHLSRPQLPALALLSAREPSTIEALWDAVEQELRTRERDGSLARRRDAQARAHFGAAARAELELRLAGDAVSTERLAQQVACGELSLADALRELLR